MGIEENFVNIYQERAEKRASVKNLTDADVKLMTQVEECDNHLESKDAEMMELTNKVTQLQGEIRNPKTKLSQSNTKIKYTVNKQKMGAKSHLN